MGRADGATVDWEVSLFAYYMLSETQTLWEVLRAERPRLDLT